MLNSKYGYRIFNNALPDATFGSYGNDSLAARSIITQVRTAQQLSTTDYAIIFAGSNDYKRGLGDIGVNDSLDEYTFKGAVSTALNELLTANPGIKVLIVTPVYRGSISSGDGNNSDETMINNKYLSAYAEALLDVAKYNHIPCVDAYATSMINKFTESHYLDTGGIYLSDSGHELMCDFIHDAMCKFY